MCIVIHIAKGWHINANPASLSALIPTEVKITVPGGRSKLIDLHYPEGEKEKLTAADESLSVYKNEITISAKIELTEMPPDAQEGSIIVSAQIQACNDQGRCLAPTHVQTKLPIIFQK